MHPVIVNLFEGSPIIIGGGGSVNINFDETAYEPSNEDDGLFVKDDDELIAVYVVDLDGLPVGSDLTRYVENRDCVITVHTINDKGVQSDIVISSQPSGAIQMKFQLNEFPPVDPRPHYNRNRKLFGPIEIYDNDTEQTVRSPVPDDGRCILTFVNSKGFGE
jgi:hypothetical protein